MKWAISSVHLLCAKSAQLKGGLAPVVPQAAEQQGVEEVELANWDMAYWSEKQRVANYAISDEEVKPYLPLPQVSEHGRFPTMLLVTIS